MLQEILKSHNDEKISELCDSALHLQEGQLPLSAENSEEERGVAVQLQGTGVTLWNKTVALKSAGAISPQLNAQSESIWYHLMNVSI